MKCHKFKKGTSKPSRCKYSSNWLLKKEELVLKISRGKGVAILNWFYRRKINPYMQTQTSRRNYLFSTDLHASDAPQKKKKFHTFKKRHGSTWESCASRQVVIYPPMAMTQRVEPGMSSTFSFSTAAADTFLFGTNTFSSQSLKEQVFSSLLLSFFTSSVVHLRRWLVSEKNSPLNYFRTLDHARRLNIA